VRIQLIVSKQSITGGAFAPAIIALLVITTLVGGVIVLSIEKIRYESIVTESLVREAAIYGARLLPFQELAKEAALKLLVDSKLISPENIQIKYSPISGILSVTVYKATFAPSLGLINKALAIPIKKQVQVHPRKVFTFLDTSSYMGPDFDSGSFFGELQIEQNDSPFARWKRVQQNSPAPSTSWPPASYFLRAAQSICAERNCPISQHLKHTLTQQCFNPLFSAVKEGVFSIHEYLANLPGTISSVFAGPDQAGKIVPISNAAAMLDVVPQPDSGISDVYCYAAAREATFSVDYQNWMQKQIPPVEYGTTLTGSLLPSVKVAPYVFPPQSWGINGERLIGHNDSFPDIIPDKSTLTPTSLTTTTVSTRAALWSKVRSSNHVASLPSILSEAESTLFSDISENSDELALALIILGDYPYGRGGSPLLELSSGQISLPVRRDINRAFSSIFKVAGNRPLWIVIAIIRHDGMSDMCSQSTDITAYHQCTDHYDRINTLTDQWIGELPAQISSLTKGDTHRVILLPVGDIDSFVYEVASYLPLIGKEIKEITDTN
jgi:hypothetical protein